MQTKILNKVKDIVPTLGEEPTEELIATKAHVLSVVETQIQKINTAQKAAVKPESAPKTDKKVDLK